MKKSEKINTVLLQVAVLALLLTVTPAVGQPNDSTASGATTTTQTAPVDGVVVDTIPVRKDTWTWYWNEKAHLDTHNKEGFWGDDAISNFFGNLTNGYLVPFWNAAMEYDIVRVIVLLILAGMLLGLGASVFLPKKSEVK